MDYHYTDTAGAIVFSGLKKLLGWHWSNDQAAGKDIAADDDFLISDTNGDRISGKRAIVAGDDLLMPISHAGITVNGLTVTTMDGGVFYCWTENL